jgi:hypothetical protein
MPAKKKRGPSIPDDVYYQPYYEGDEVIFIVVEEP